MPIGTEKNALLGSGGAAFSATGGAESTYTDGGVDYKVHTFSTGTSTLSVEGGPGNVDLLIVGGGGTGVVTYVFNSVSYLRPTNFCATLF